MDKTECVAVLKALSDGIHPSTGENLPASSVAQDPKVIRALFHALSLLNNSSKPGQPYKRTFKAKPKTTKLLPQHDPLKPRNAGKPWLNQDFNSLLLGTNSGKSIESLAEELERTPLAIAAKLHERGLISESQYNQYRYTGPNQ